MGSIAVVQGQGLNTNVNTRAKFKSLFIYNFTKYTEWPDSYKQGDFIIGVVNDDDLATNLEEFARTKKVNSQTVVVKRFTSPAEVNKVHVLYVTGNSAGAIEPYVNKTNQTSTLVVTEGPGLADRLSAINFVVVGSALKFELNKRTFQNQGLVVSKSLENLATKVIN